MIKKNIVDVNKNINMKYTSKKDATNLTAHQKF